MFYPADKHPGRLVGSGKKSLAYSLAYQAPDRTLTDAEVAKVRARIVKKLQDEIQKLTDRHIKEIDQPTACAQEFRSGLSRRHSGCASWRIGNVKFFPSQELSVQAGPG